VPPIVETAWRELVPATPCATSFPSSARKFRQRGRPRLIRKRLAVDGIVSRSHARDIETPQNTEGPRVSAAEGAGERSDGSGDRVHRKQVKVAEARCRRNQGSTGQGKPRDGRRSECAGKGESDAINTCCPWKEKQIQQSKLEAEARKENHRKGPKQAADAKVIDSKAEMERRKLLAQRGRTHSA